MLYENRVGEGKGLGVKSLEKLKKQLFFNFVKLIREWGKCTTHYVWLYAIQLVRSLLNQLRMFFHCVPKTGSTCGINAAGDGSEVSTNCNVPKFRNIKFIITLK